MSAATGFGPSTITEQCIESAGSVSLNDAVEVIQEFEISCERLIGGVVEHIDRVRGIADVGGDLAFAQVVFVVAILDLYERVVSFDDLGSTSSVVCCAASSKICADTKASGGAWSSGFFGDSEYVPVILRIQRQKVTGCKSLLRANSEADCLLCF